MPRLSRTTELTALSYSLPELKQSVTVHLPGSDLVKQHISKTSSHRILEIPVGSKWSPGAHWHEEHVEHIRIIRGSATVWINGVSKELGPQGEATFEKFAIHDFCRSGQDENEPLLIEEWTETEDGTKDVFFRNAFSLVNDRDQFGGLLYAFLRFFFLCSYRDNYIAFWRPACPKYIQRTTTYTIFAIIQFVGRLAGWTSWYKEYTPANLEGVATKTSSLEQKSR